MRGIVAQGLNPSLKAFSWRTAGSESTYGETSVHNQRERPAPSAGGAVTPPRCATARFACGTQVLEAAELKEPDMQAICVSAMRGLEVREELRDLPIGHLLVRIEAAAVSLL
jgi:hypothetical protein